MTLSTLVDLYRSDIRVHQKHGFLHKNGNNSISKKSEKSLQKPFLDFLYAFQVSKVHILLATQLISLQGGQQGFALTGFKWERMPSIATFPIK